jgi:hypothetical protein
MKNLALILQLLPLILMAVRSVEEQIPVGGAGKQKLDLILSVVEEGYASGLIEDATAPKKNVLNLITKSTNLVVNTLNLLGVFKKEPINVTPAS